MGKDRRGFTLVELIATLVVLALVMSIGSYTIVNLINKSKDENYALLIENIQSAVDLYYQECRYGDTISNSNDEICKVYGNTEEYYLIKLGDLVTYGFLKGNGEGDNKLTTLFDPRDNKDISYCEIKIEYDSNGLKVSPVTANGSCPSGY